jgi:hypothetical protein
MVRALCGMQKKLKTFWVNIKNKGMWNPNLAPGGGAAFPPYLLWPTITTQQRPNTEGSGAFLLLLLFNAAYGCHVLVCWLLALRTAKGGETLRTSSPEPYPALHQALSLYHFYPDVGLS